MSQGHCMQVTNEAMSLTTYCCTVHSDEQSLPMYAMAPRERNWKFLEKYFSSTAAPFCASKQCEQLSFTICPGRRNDISAATKLSHYIAACKGFRKQTVHLGRCRGVFPPAGEWSHQAAAAGDISPVNHARHVGALLASHLQRRQPISVTAALLSQERDRQAPRKVAIAAQGVRQTALCHSHPLPTVPCQGAGQVIQKIQPEQSGRSGR